MFVLTYGRILKPWLTWSRASSKRDSRLPTQLKKTTERLTQCSPMLFLKLLVMLLDNQ